MFGRRKPISILTRLKLVFAPSGGWRRQGSYISHRLKRLPGTPTRIAAGFACGAAISFTPFVGFHFLISAGLALLMRANILASAFGTVVGNPWTFPLIWFWTYKAGVWMLGTEGAADLPEQFSFQFILDRPLKVLWPMFVGSLPTVIVAWILFFFPIRSVVKKYRSKRRQRLRWKVRRRLEKLRAQGQKAGKPSASPSHGEALAKEQA